MIWLGDDLAGADLAGADLAGADVEGLFHHVAYICRYSVSKDIECKASTLKIVKKICLVHIVQNI